MIHNHQPVGNDPAILEEIYRKAYHPLLKKLSEVPTIRANIHYSGYLLEWMEQIHPEFIDLLRKMVERDQVEIVGGGYYEPILGCIPDRDAEGQVALLGEKIGSLFGRRPHGLWTAERAWEPQMPEVIQRCGISYTALDDTIFGRSGITERECLRPYIVESRGSSVTVFPILKRLRYLMPWKSERLAIDFLRDHADEAGQRIAVFGDDGEKFGAWPTTFRLVYEKGWLEKFLGLLVSNQDWLRTVRLSDYLSEQKPHDRVYLPSASYDEMMEWSLPIGSSARRGVTRGPTNGFWRNFLSKYPESGRMYAKMLWVSELAQRVADDGTTAKKKKKQIEILHEVWKGQSNDAYWHGVFGGLYFSTLRRTIYHHLLQAQRMSESVIHAAGRNGAWAEVREEVLNGYRELSIDTSSLGLRVCPGLGGSLAELDFKEGALNITDTLQRRRESYHREIRSRGNRRDSTSEQKARSIHDPLVSKESGLADLLVYDRYPKYSFLDFLVEEETEIEDFVRQSYREMAEFAGKPYEARLETNEAGPRLQLSRQSSLDRGRSWMRIEKTLDVALSGCALACRYKVERSAGEGGARGRLAIELSFGCLGDREFVKRYSEPSRNSRVSARDIVYPEVGVAVSVELSRPVELWCVPIKTVSRSESGFESNLQGISIIPNFSLGDESDLEVRVSVKKI